MDHEQITTEQRTREEAIAELTGPGGAFEIVTGDVDGRSLPVYLHAAPDLRVVFERSLDFGDRDFLVYGTTRWSYREHGERVRRLAAHMTEAGIGPGDRVAIGMRNYPEWVLAFWTVQVIGAVAVPLNAWWTGGELEYGLMDSGATALVVDDERLERLATFLPGPIHTTYVVRPQGAIPDWAIDLEEVIEAAGDVPPLLDVEIAPDDPSTIMYTSGTTGLPKGAVQTHRNHSTNLMNTAFGGALATARAPESTIAPDDAPASIVSLQTFPFFHIGGMSGLYVSTAFGVTLVCMHKWDPVEAVRLVQDEHVTAVAGVPTVIRQLFDELDRQGVVAESLGSVAAGGSPVPPSLIDRIGDRSARAIRPGNGYGLTETTSAVVANSGDDYYDHPDSVGRPVPVAEVSVRDESGSPVDDGTTGELWVRGPNVVAGYWNNPEATAAAFTDGWFHTGDAAFVRDGFVYVVDRIKDVVIRGGENVYCAEVESAIYAIPGVVDVAVIGVPHDVLGEDVGAVVEFEAGAESTGADLRRAVAAGLATFKVPSRLWASTGPLPRNATGKLLKRELRVAVVEADSSYVEI